MPYSSFSKLFLRVVIVLSFGVMGAVLVAEADGPGQDAPPMQEPQDCAECHVDIVAGWQEGLHAQAYSDPVFQEAWEQQADKNPECLACHTTGFVAYTGEYDAEGVTCEACHGPTPANHPPEAVSVERGVEVCAGCHEDTYHEWQNSAHGEEGIACTTCHNPHPQTLRFDNNADNALCLDCHGEDERDDYTHLVHSEEQCVDCHWHHASEEDIAAHAAQGLPITTGHTAKVETKACVDCHEEITDRDVMEVSQAVLDELGLPETHPLHAANVRIKELEAKVHTLDAEGANTSALRLLQGFVIGVVIGGVFVLGVTRFRRRSTAITERDEE